MRVLALKSINPDWVLVRGVGVLILAMAGALAAGVSAVLAQQEDNLSGRFVGFAMSEGIVVSLAEENDRVLGQYTDAMGKVFALNGQRVGSRAQGLLEREGLSAFFQLEMRPLGIQFLYIPSADDGRPNLADALQSSLARDSVDVETLLGQEPREPSTGNVVLQDDATGEELASRYVALAPRERELIRLFDHVQAHLTGRLCTAVERKELDGDSKAVALALERQQAGCGAIASLRDRAAASENYDAFEARLAVQQELLTTTMACDAGDNSAETCQTAGAMNAEMFEQWRRAAVIFAEVADQGGTGQGTASEVGRGPIDLRGGELRGGVGNDTDRLPVPGVRPGG